MKPYFCSLCHTDFNSDEIKSHAKSHFARGEGGDFIQFTNAAGVPMFGVATEEATNRAYLKWAQQRGESPREMLRFFIIE